MVGLGLQDLSCLVTGPSRFRPMSRGCVSRPTCSKGVLSPRFTLQTVAKCKTPCSPNTFKTRKKRDKTKPGPLVGRFARIDSRFEEKTSFCESTFQKWDISEDWTRITRISMRIGEKTRFARIWPSASKIGFFLRIDSRESAKRWCANRLPTKIVTGLITGISLKLARRTIKQERRREKDKCLDGRNRAIVTAESLARVISAIRVASVRWRSHISPKTQKLVLTEPAFVVLRFESRDWRSFVQYSFHVELWKACKS